MNPCLLTRHWIWLKCLDNHSGRNSLFDEIGWGLFVLTLERVCELAEGRMQWQQHVLKPLHISLLILDLLALDWTSNLEAKTGAYVEHWTKPDAMSSSSRVRTNFPCLRVMKKHRGFRFLFCFPGTSILIRAFGSFFIADLMVLQSLRHGAFLGSFPNLERIGAVSFWFWLHVRG